MIFLFVLFFSRVQLLDCIPDNLSFANKIWTWHVLFAAQAVWSNRSPGDLRSELPLWAWNEGRKQHRTTRKSYHRGKDGLDWEVRSYCAAGIASDSPQSRWAHESLFQLVILLRHFWAWAQQHGLLGTTWQISLRMTINAEKSIVTSSAEKQTTQTHSVTW